jgi:membrane-anchored glycerophosphoryl diester phosphodiesterase (GDPDase)
MKTELLLAVMAGVVLSLFLIVGEIAALRTRVSRIRRYLWDLYREGRFFRLLGMLFCIAAFFLVQPFIVALLVILALDNLVPHFSGSVIHQFREALAALVG